MIYLVIGKEVYIMNIFEFFGDKELMEEFKPKILKASKKKLESQKSLVIVEESHKNNLEKKEITYDKIPQKSTAVLEETHNMQDIEDNLGIFDFKGSSVRKARIEGIEIGKLSFWGVIKAIYEFLGNVDNVVENSTLSIVEGKYTEKGYAYVKDLDISVQGVTADRSVKEIFSQVLNNNLTFCMEIDNYPRRWVFMNE